MHCESPPQPDFPEIATYPRGTAVWPNPCSTLPHSHEPSCVLTVLPTVVSMDYPLLSYSKRPFVARYVVAKLSNGVMPSDQSSSHRTPCSISLKAPPFFVAGNARAWSPLDPPDVRCRAKMPPMKQSSAGSRLGYQVKVLSTFLSVRFLL